MFCSILFWLAHWTSTVQTFPFIITFQLPHMQSDLNYTFHCSTIAFFYVIFSSPLLHILFFLSSLRLFSFLPLISLSPSRLFAMLIFLFQSPGFQLSAFFFLVLISSSWFFILHLHSLLIQHHCCVLYSLFCMPFSCFHHYPCIWCIDW